MASFYEQFMRQLNQQMKQSLSRASQQVRTATFELPPSDPNDPKGVPDEPLQQTQLRSPSAEFSRLTQRARIPGRVQKKTTPKNQRPGDYEFTPEQQKAAEEQIVEVFERAFKEGTR